MTYSTAATRLVEDKRVQVAFWLGIVLLSGMQIRVCLNSQSYLRSNDAFYYLSIADNVLQNHTFLDGTTTPNGPVITPQNGIVGIFYVLRLFALSKHQCLLFMLGLNLVLLVSCIYPFIKIAEIVGISGRIPLYALLLLSVGSQRIFMWLYMAPVNDMIFFTGQLWMLYGLYRICEHNDGTPCNRGTLNGMRAAVILISVVLIHFRINALFVPAAGIPAALLSRRYKILPLLAVQLVVMVLSLLASYWVVDRYDFQANTAHLQLSVDSVKHLVYVFFFQLLPAGLFKDLNATGNLLYLPFYVGMLMALIDGIRQRNIVLLMLLLICCQTFLMTILHGCITERYLWVITLFMYMMLLRTDVLRVTGYFFIAAVVINTFWTWGFSSNQLRAWRTIAEHDVLKKDNIVMIAYDKRSNWYFTDIPSVYRDEYTWQQLANASSVCIIGPADYVDGHVEQINSLALSHNYTVESVIDYDTGSPADMDFREVRLSPFPESDATPRPVEPAQQPPS